MRIPIGKAKLEVVPLWRSGHETNLWRVRLPKTRRDVEIVLTDEEAEIAEIEAARERAPRIGRRVTEWQAAQVDRLLRSGLSQSEVSRRTGVSRRTVRQIACRINCIKNKEEQ
jgi:hypothetical protein